MDSKRHIVTGGGRRVGRTATMEALKKFSPAMQELYLNYAPAQQAVDALVHGADVYHLLEVALRTNEELTKELVRSKALQMPHTLRF